MKRHIALRQLSSEHHQSLVHARRLHQASAGKGSPASAAEAFMHFADGSLATHFHSEEEILLPEYATWTEEWEESAGRVMLDHLAIRAMVLALKAALLQGRAPTELLGQLGTRLEAHVRYEERQFFPEVERQLPPERLAAVGVLIASGTVDPR